MLSTEDEENSSFPFLPLREVLGCELELRPSSGLPMYCTKDRQAHVVAELFLYQNLNYQGFETAIFYPSFADYQLTLPARSDPFTLRLVQCSGLLECRE